MLKLSTPNIDEAELEAVARVLKSGNLVYGQVGKEFESKIAKFTGAAEAILVSSGTAALHLSLLANEISKSDYVLVPGFTFPATANVVRMCGAEPVFIDVSPDTYNITAIQAQAAYDNCPDKEKIKAIIPVHEFGLPCDMDEIVAFAEKNKLIIIEDAACAMGAKFKGRHVGTFGSAGCFSFHPRKTLTTGEGGVITTNDKYFANEARKLRNHGIEYKDFKPFFSREGLNYRLSDILSAIGIVQLSKLPSALIQRDKLSKIYLQELKNTPLALPAIVNGQSWQTFMVVLPDHMEQSRVIATLANKNIETNLGAQALMELSPFKNCRDYNLQMKISEKLYRHGLALPLCESYSEEQIKYVCEELKKLIFK